MARLAMITVDTTDARALAAWWAKILGGTVADDNEGWFCTVSAPELPLVLGFQKVDDPTPGKNRLHLDLDLEPGETNRAAAVDRLVTAGATHIEQHTISGFTWDVLADPDGNRFCLGDPH
ncbi:VOC family protein [Mycetocola spongiae]|uniref:VOC family protein n=1 Tax=Mycetocola spongiae TaxID=2859226 RepID=UPI001CF2DB5B|nr:VOC family protein [Mycetocola spongiae]UCR89543.1 VOC family protein [Mycetocola spongiae]